MAYELAIIVPTLNEKDNLGILVSRIEAALPAVEWELIFVDDDSRDGTWSSAWQLSEARPNIRCIRRVGRRGLASACVEGMLASGARYFAVMDADLQHDEKLLAEMLRLMRSGEFDIVVASRFKDADRVEGLSAARERMSRIGNWVSRRVCKADLSDPLSGFFMLRRGTLEDAVYSLSNLGFKILVDIFASSSRPPRFCELGFTFKPRQHGESKLDSAVMTEFGLLLCDKTLGKYIPARFVAFLLVGVIGMVLHLTLLGLQVRLLGMPFLRSQAVATVVAILGNYYFNNELTYRDLRLKGRAFWTGLAGFAAVCATGAWINFVLARVLYDGGAHWLLAGAVGALLGGVWNYTLTSFFVWRARAVPRRVPDVGEVRVASPVVPAIHSDDGLE